MTREEAVKRIKEIQKLYVFTPTINEAFDLAIEALQEKHQLSGETSTISEKEIFEGDAESATTTDCISRQDAIDAVEKHAKIFDELSCLDDFTIGAVGGLRRAKELLEYLPPVTPTEQQEHGRLIDADALKEYIYTDEHPYNNKWDIEAVEWEDIENAPTIVPGTPTERTGEWKKEENENLGKCLRVVYVCSACGCAVGCEYFVRRSYCPNCGAKMGGDTE